MILKIYLRILAITYFAGFTLHLADVLDFRLAFSEMGPMWRIWIVYLLFMDLMAGLGLWKQRPWGVGLFVAIAVSQLVAYVGFTDRFGRQDFLVGFHLATLASYALARHLDSKSKRRHQANAFLSTQPHLRNSRLTGQ